MQSIASLIKKKKFNITQENVGIKPDANNPAEFFKLKGLVNSQSDNIVSVMSGGNIDNTNGNLSSYEYVTKNYGEITHATMKVSEGYLDGHRYSIELNVYEDSDGILRAWYVGFMANLETCYIRNLIGKWNESGLRGGRDTSNSRDFI